MNVFHFAVSILDPDTNVPTTPATGSELQDILNFVFGLAGAIAVLIIVIAGFRFVISQGDPQKVAQARMAILYAVVGLVVAIFSFIIVNFVIGEIG